MKGKRAAANKGAAGLEERHTVVAAEAGRNDSEEEHRRLLKERTAEDGEKWSALS